jgi:hypothetical protein
MGGPSFEKDAQMTATARVRRPQASSRWNDRFLELLSVIRDQAQFAFRRVPFDAREELIQETVSQAYFLFVRLVQRGKTALGYATPLARFAIRRVKAGRRLGSRCNRQDITSPCAYSSKSIRIKRLDQLDLRTAEWREALLEDRKAGPSQIVQMRIDFADWLKSLPHRDRRLAQTLARGETTACTARLFKISAGRVSQLRRDLCDSWHRFIGELPEPQLARIAVA